jgi:hypothetical protein
MAHHRLLRGLAFAPTLWHNRSLLGVQLHNPSVLGFPFASFRDRNVGAFEGDEISGIGRWQVNKAWWRVSSNSKGALTLGHLAVVVAVFTPNTSKDVLIRRYATSLNKWRGAIKHRPCKGEWETIPGPDWLMGRTGQFPVGRSDFWAARAGVQLLFLFIYLFRAAVRVPPSGRSLTLCPLVVVFRSPTPLRTPCPPPPRQDICAGGRYGPETPWLKKGPTPALVHSLFFTA